MVDLLRCLATRRLIPVGRVAGGMAMVVILFMLIATDVGFTVLFERLGII